MIEFVPVLVLLALVWATISFLKDLTNGKTNGMITQVIVWAAGVLFAWLFSESDFGSSIAIGDTGQTLGSINVASLVLVGMAVGSLASVAYEFKKARDNNDSAVEPKLLPKSDG